MAKAGTPGQTAAAQDGPVFKQQTIDADPRLEKLIENSFSGISLLDKDLHVFYRSPSAERIIGLGAVKREESSMFDRILPEHRETLQLLLHEVCNTPGLSKTCSYQAKHSKGHFIWLESIYTNMLHEPGIEAIVCNFIDITAKKQAEELLQQNNNELFAYKYALDEAAIVSITDQRGIIKYVNDNFCNISKYSAAELIGQDHRIINSGYHDKAYIRNLWATIAKGKIWKGEFRNRAKDGSFYWVNATIVPFLNAQGKPYQYVAIRFDITQNKLTEQKIIENEEFLKTITDHSPAMIAYWDANERCLFANKPYREWFDKQPAAIIGATKRDLLGEEEYATHRSHIKSVLRGEARRFERTFCNGAGRKIFTDTQYLPDKAGGMVKGFYSMIYDITPVKLAEIAGKRSLEERNTILESIDDAFFAVDKNWVVTYWNNMAEKVLLKTRDEMLFRNLWEVFSDSVESLSFKKYHHAMETGQVTRFEDHYAPLDRWYEISAYPADTGLSVYFKDITERKISEGRLKELNEELKKHARDLAHSNAELEQFAYVASHDLQEPLRMVTSFMTQLEKKYGDVVDDKGKQYIHFAVDGAKRMRQIILDLLEFSRVGRMDDEPEEVDLNKLINELLALYRKQIEETGASIKVDSLPIMHTYKTPMRQVLQNLVSNGLKYQAPGNKPEINIFCRENDKHWQFSVKDNGIGIDAAYFDKIFIIFQRLHTSDEFHGTGMGLAITKKIVENMGGKIWIESEQGKGSTFHFTIKKIEKL